MMKKLEMCTVRPLNQDDISDALGIKVKMAYWLCHRFNLNMIVWHFAVQRKLAQTCNGVLTLVSGDPEPSIQGFRQIGIVLPVDSNCYVFLWNKIICLEGLVMLFFSFFRTLVDRNVQVSRQQFICYHIENTGIFLRTTLQTEWTQVTVELKNDLCITGWIAIAFDIMQLHWVLPELFMSKLNIIESWLETYCHRISCILLHVCKGTLQSADQFLNLKLANALPLSHGNTSRPDTNSTPTNVKWGQREWSRPISSLAFSEELLYPRHFICVISDVVCVHNEFVNLASNKFHLPINAWLRLCGGSVVRYVHLPAHEAIFPWLDFGFSTESVFSLMM